MLEVSDRRSFTDQSTPSVKLPDSNLVNAFEGHALRLVTIRLCHHFTWGFRDRAGKLLMPIY